MRCNTEQEEENEMQKTFAMDVNESFGTVAGGIKNGNRLRQSTNSQDLDFYDSNNRDQYNYNTHYQQPSESVSPQRIQSPTSVTSFHEQHRRAKKDDAKEILKNLRESVQRVRVQSQLRDS